jgi:hypothetical protein
MDHFSETALFKTNLETLRIILENEKVDLNVKNAEGLTLLHKLAFLNLHDNF